MTHVRGRAPAVSKIMRPKAAVRDLRSIRANSCCSALQTGGGGWCGETAHKATQRQTHNQTQAHTHTHFRTRAYFSSVRENGEYGSMVGRIEFAGVHCHSPILFQHQLPTRPPARYTNNHDSRNPEETECYQFPEEWNPELATFLHAYRAVGSD